MGVRYHRASLFLELGEHQRAAESYGQIWKLRLMNVEALKTAAKIDGACKAKNGAHNEREDPKHHLPET